MEDGLVWVHRPTLRRPVLVAAFEGWNDAADAASSAAGWLVEHGESTEIASIDPEEHVDFQSRRPVVELVEGVTRRVTWPANTFHTVHVGGRDLVVLRGVEPSYRWRSFCRAVLTVASETGCGLIVTMGALLADVPHTRVPRVTGAATDPGLVRDLQLTPSRYEGPTGIVGVLHDSCREAAVPSVSLWAPVPHYIAAPPNPPATLGLLERLRVLGDLDLDLRRLERTAASWRRRVDEVAAGDDDVRGYVAKLEERYDADTEGSASDASWGDRLPTGDELASELERFLREEHDDGP